jgi:hypothetical protein
MILLWGPPHDGTLRAVAGALPGAYVLDQSEALDTRVHRGILRSPAGDLELRDVAAAYLRPYASRDAPAVREAGEAAVEHAERLDEALGAWADCAPCRVVNRPSAGASNASKPRQLHAIAAAGFTVPATLVTSDPGAARAFLAAHGEVVYKSVSAVRSIVGRLTAADAARLDDVARCPTQFQERVPGTDVRVHVVGEATFAAEIASTAVDYRYGEGEDAATLRGCMLPADVAQRCVSLAAALQLPVAGIDLRRRPDGRFVCFEVNPSPAFSYYEHHTGLPIAAAVARFLGDAPAPGEEMRVPPLIGRAARAAVAPATEVRAA